MFEPWLKHRTLLRSVYYLAVAIGLSRTAVMAVLSFITSYSSV
jgi:hypothetical protein